MGAGAQKKEFGEDGATVTAVSWAEGRWARVRVGCAGHSVRSILNTVEGQGEGREHGCSSKPRARC